MGTPVTAMWHHLQPECRGGIMQNGLIYDVGGFDGADTAHYLKLGYRVLCIEAAPHLAAKITQRFYSEIAAGRCTVLNVAVGAREGILPFYICREDEALSSFDRSRLDGAGLTACETSVPVRPFLTILAEFGVPNFLKVDIEGADRHAILPLTRENAPEFVSFEAGRNDLDLILHLYGIGYRRYNIVRQDVHMPVEIPLEGTAARIKWSARQWLRMSLRAHPALHTVARRLRAGKLGQAAGVATGMHVIAISGPTPMEQTRGWRNTEVMLRDWTALVASGMIDSAWFDVHAQLA